jgi:hypothetical protein
MYHSRAIVVICSLRELGHIPGTHFEYVNRTQEGKQFDYEDALVLENDTVPLLL